MTWKGAVLVSGRVDERRLAAFGDSVLRWNSQEFTP